MLEQTEFFAALPAEQLSELRSRARQIDLERGDELFRKGDDAAHCFIVVDGRIAISARASDGRESVVAVLGPGQLVGEMALFDDGPRSADARALTPSRLLVLSYADVQTALEERPEVLWRVVRLLANRLRITDDALADAMFLDVPGRTAKRLLEIAGDADDFEMLLTQEELASVVGASRERINRAIATFVKLGWLEIKGRSRYHILSREELITRASS